MPQSFLEKLPLSRYEIDRDHLTRDRPDLFEQLWADPATRVLPVFKGSALLAQDGSLALLPPHALPDAIELKLYLGRSISTTSPEPVGTALVAVELADAGHFAESDWADLRRVGHSLSNRDAGMLTEALAMLNWHAANRFSPRTGAPTVSEKGGWVRRDPVADTEHFPRTDPAIIVGITDGDDRMLLGSNALWESNRYSLLAGFVEPGESLESAVIREVFEESGIRVVDPVYLGSQPWPFPASLMLGFTATVDPAHGTVATPDGAEILDLRWFTRDELRAAAAADEIRLPGPTSIARAIIDEWNGVPVDDGPR
jgi:NAD+ diphosphatase